MKPAVFCRKLKTAARLFSRVSYYCITEGPIKAHERVKTYLTVKHEREILHEQMGDFSDCIEDYAVYDSEYQDNLDFSGCHTDIKALAFYLPQFHTFSENDAWWGRTLLSGQIRENLFLDLRIIINQENRMKILVITI